MRDAAPRLQLHVSSNSPKSSHFSLTTTVDANPKGPPKPCELIEGDNLEVLRCLAQQRPGSITLAYLDPPFFTGRKHNRVERKKTETGIERQELVAFDDRWQSLSHYLAAIKDRLNVIHTLLSDEGCVVIHVDPKTSHYIKVICDELFGIDSFASEVIWRYRRWPSKTKNFQRVHDVMLRYVKEPGHPPRFNQLYEPLSASTQKTWGDRKQRAVVSQQGRRLRSSTTEEPSRGVPLGDVWEMPIVAPVAKERTGYPTQKPEALMRRWIEACTDPGDLVLDPYMGSGTTLKVSADMGRFAIGIDAGEHAHSITRQRLEAAQIEFVETKLLKQENARPSGPVKVRLSTTGTKNALAPERESRPRSAPATSALVG